MFHAAAVQDAAEAEHGPYNAAADEAVNAALHEVLNDLEASFQDVANRHLKHGTRH
jgi:hypothetical protein